MCQEIDKGKGNGWYDRLSLFGWFIEPNFPIDWSPVDLSWSRKHDKKLYIHTYVYIYIERERCVYIFIHSPFFFAFLLSFFLSFFLFSYVCPCFCFCFYFVWFSSAVIHITSSCLCCSYSCFQRIDCPFCIEVYRLRIWCSISLLSACVSKSRSLGFGSLTSPNFLD